MKNTVMGIGLFVAGVAGGVAFVVSCGNASTSEDGDGNGVGRYIGPPRAIAQLNCSRFETTIVETSEAYLVPTTLPAGWVPSGISTGNNVVVARCAQ